MNRARKTDRRACAVLGVCAGARAAARPGRRRGVGRRRGSQVVGVDLETGLRPSLRAINHSLGLKADGSIVAWGNNDSGQMPRALEHGASSRSRGGLHHSLG